LFKLILAVFLIQHIINGKIVSVKTLKKYF